MAKPLKNEERELLGKTIHVLRRKARDRNFVADQLQMLLDEGSRLSVEGRSRISTAATIKAEQTRAAKKNSKVQVISHKKPKAA